MFVDLLPAIWLVFKFFYSVCKEIWCLQLLQEPPSLDISQSSAVICSSRAYLTCPILVDTTCCLSIDDALSSECLRSLDLSPYRHRIHSSAWLQNQRHPHTQSWFNGRSGKSSNAKVPTSALKIPLLSVYVTSKSLDPCVHILQRRNSPLVKISVDGTELLCLNCTSQK